MNGLEERITPSAILVPVPTTNRESDIGVRIDIGIAFGNKITGSIPIPIPIILIPVSFSRQKPYECFERE